jgi:hypothetical protein
MVKNMKMNKNKNKKLQNSNKNKNANDNADQSQVLDTDQSQVLDNLHNPKCVSKHNNGAFDFEINTQFIKENKKINLNLVRHGQNHKQKFAPFTRSQIRKRRLEDYKLHFEHGVPATRIAELKKVDRNTINNDLKILYRKSLKDYNPDDISLDDVLQQQLLRLETQRDRLGLYLSDTKEAGVKLSV